MVVWGSFENVPMYTLVEWTSWTVVCTVSENLTPSLRVLYDLLYDHTRIWHPYQVYKSFKNHSQLSRIHSNDPSVTRIRPRLVRLYVQFTRVANRVSRVFYVSLKLILCPASTWNSSCTIGCNLLERAEKWLRNTK